MKFSRIRQRFLSVILILVLLSTLVIPVSALSEGDLYSTAAFVMDAASGTEIWSKNPDKVMVPASITKMMTAYLVFEAIDQGQFSPDSVVPISAGVSIFSYNYRYSNVPLSTSGTYTVDQLLEAMIVSSACAAANALGEMVSGSTTAFVALMNQKCDELNIDCSFADCYGGSNQNQVTARGLATLCYRMVTDHPEYLNYSRRPSYVFGGTTYKSTNLFLSGQFSCDGTVDGLKTGTLGTAGYCFCSTAYKGDDRVIVVSLQSPYPQKNFEDHVKLINYGLANIPEPRIPVAPFIDVYEDDWYAGAVSSAYENNLMIGTSGTTFEPNLNLTRAMMAQLLYNLEGNPVLSEDTDTFLDVTSGAWYYSAVEWAASQELVFGRGEGVFDPEGNITRQEMVVMLYRYHLLKDRNDTDGADLSQFTDYDLISDFALSALDWAVGSDVIHGTGNGMLSPLGTATRAEVAMMLNNYIPCYQK